MDSIDDDFGELYADVEVQVKTILHNAPDFTKIYAQAEETNKNTNFQSEEKRVSLEADDDDDSEDELRIVLNDEDCEKLTVTGGGGGGGEEEGDGLDLDSNNNDKNNGDPCNLQRQQHLQYKYIRSNGSTNGCTGTASLASMLARGDWKDSRCNQRKGSMSVAPQCAYGFSLPRYRTILDVDIDAFEKKPWNHSEANISDFFNFGFNEDSWKSYCSLLGQFRDHTSVQATNAVYEYSKIDQPRGRAIEVEDSISERQPSMDVKCPRMQDSDVVIQINVQDCTEDFSSSGKEEYGHINTTSGDHETSTNGDLDLDRNRGVPCCGSASRDEVSADFHEKDITNADLSSALRRFSEAKGVSNQTSAGSDDHGNGQISDRDGHRHQNLSVHGLERTSKTMEELKWTEEVDGRKACDSDLFLETEISLADHSHFCLSPSFSGNNSDVSKNSFHGDPVRVYCPSKSQSPNSGTEVISDNKDSISYGIHRKPDDRRYHLKQRSHNREDWKQHSRRCRGVRKLKTYPKPDDDVSPLSDDEDDAKDFSRHVPVREKWKNCHGIHHTVSEKKIQPENVYYPDREGLHYRDYKSFCRQRQRLTDLEYHDTEEFSCNKEAAFSSSYGSERFGDKHFKFVQQNYPHGKNHQLFRDWIDPYVSSRRNERKYSHERSARVDNEDYIGRDQYYCKRGDRESRLFVPKYSSTFSERDTKWRSKNDKPIVRRINQDWCLYEFVEDDFVQEKYVRSVSFTDKERDYMDTMYERDLPFIGSEEKISVQRGHNGDSHCLDLDSSWSMEIENEYQRCTRHESSTSRSRRECFGDNERRWHEGMTSVDDVYDSKLTERYRRYREHIYNEEHRDIDLSGIYKVTDDTEDSILDTDDWVHLWRRRHSWQSKELHRMEDELITTNCDSELFAEKSSFSYNKTSMCERICPKYEYDHNGLLFDDVQLEHHRSKLIREESSAKCVDKDYNIINRGEHEHTVPRCRNSVDWFVGEEKSSGRWSKGRSLMCSGKVETMDLKLAKEQKNLVLKDSHEFDRGQAVGTHLPKSKSNRSNEKWLDKFPVTQPNEDLDIEEGQIVTEETNTEKDLENKHSSESTASTSNVKKRITYSENASSENKAVGEYDNQRLLETLAKMEKRRERFKDFILPKKEPDNNPELQADLMVDTAETKKQRPARKRRWNQS